MTDTQLSHLKRIPGKSTTLESNKSHQSLARYVATYVVSPPIAVRRIDRYDGKRGTYHDRSHRTDRVEHETVEVETFIGRMVQHIGPKGFKRIRYYGVQATKTFAKVK